MLLPKFLQQLDAFCDTYRDDESTFVQVLLDAAVHWGFKSARYYEVAKDPADNDHEAVILRAFRRHTGASELPVGYSIPFRESTVGGAGNGDIIFGDPGSSPAHATKWIEALGLTQDRWADVAIRDHNADLHYLLALSVDINTEFPEDAIAPLRQIKRMVEGYYATLRARRLTAMRMALKSFSEGQPRHKPVLVAPLAELAARIVLPISGATVCSIFHHRWASRELVKVAEHTIDDHPARGTNLHEVVSVGQHLTGRAWENERLRHIPDFRKYLRQHPTLECPAVEHHRASGAPIRSVMYEAFGRLHLHFFVRLFNRSDDQELPLSYRHRDYLQRACADLHEYTSDLAREAIISAFAEQSSAIRHVTNRDVSVAAADASLSSIGFEKATLLYRPTGDARFEVLKCSDPKLKPHLVQAMLDVPEDSLLAKAAKETGIHLARVSDSEKASGDVLGSALHAAGAVATVSVCSVGDAGAVVALRAAYGTEAKFHAAVVLLEPRQDVVAVTSMLAILCGALDAARSTVSAAVADQLVAHFGHEVATPLATLQQKAITAVNRAIKVLRTLPGMEAEVAALASKKIEVDGVSNQISRQMQAAILLASQSDGRIDVAFEWVSWSEVLNEAWQEAVEWVAEATGSGRSSLAPVELEVNAAMRTMRSICDRSLLYAIFGNVLKNAIKYSLPPGHRKTMVVKAHGNPQKGMNILRIENWGIGIPADQRERIFGRYYRVERIDRFRPIRGLGLGLYLARLFARAHGGEVTCSSSEPTLDDRRRHAQMEGFLTVFEIRIPTALLPGVTKVRVEGM